MAPTLGSQTYPVDFTAECHRSDVRSLGSRRLSSVAPLSSGSLVLAPEDDGERPRNRLSRYQIDELAIELEYQSMEPCRLGT